MDFLPFRPCRERWRTSARALAACGLAIFAAACGTTIEDAVPGASRTGIYPNLNIRQHAATEQLTDNETKAGVAALSAARRQQQAAGNGSVSEAERLRRLRQSHADAALQEIEN